MHQDLATDNLATDDLATDDLVTDDFVTFEKFLKFFFWEKEVPMIVELRFFLLNIKISSFLIIKDLGFLSKMSIIHILVAEDYL